MDPSIARKTWRTLGDGVAEAAELARRAALVASGRTEGRPRFAGHAALPWPDVPHLELWHAQTLLREFRGDGHIAALTAEDALRARGWLDDNGAFTDVGRARRAAIEELTDELATEPYAALGEADCERLRALVRPASRALATVFG